MFLFVVNGKPNIRFIIFIENYHD